MKDSTIICEILVFVLWKMSDWEPFKKVKITNFEPFSDLTSKSGSEQMSISQERKVEIKKFFHFEWQEGFHHNLRNFGVCTVKNERTGTVSKSENHTFWGSSFTQKMHWGGWRASQTFCQTEACSSKTVNHRVLVKTFSESRQKFLHSEKEWCPGCE